MEGPCRRRSRKSFDGGYLPACRLGQGHDTGTNRNTVNVHRAGTALAFTATIFSALEADVVANKIKQSDIPVLRRYGCGFAVYHNLHVVFLS